MSDEMEKIILQADIDWEAMSDKAKRQLSKTGMQRSNFIAYALRLKGCVFRDEGVRVEEIIKFIDDWELTEFGHYECDCVPANPEQVRKLANTIATHFHPKEIMLPDKKEVVGWSGNAMFNEGWNACIDKVKKILCEAGVGVKEGNEGKGKENE